MSERNFISDYYIECARLLNTSGIADNVIAAKQMITDGASSGGKLIFAGNGASASIANHGSLDFTKQAKIRSVNFNESAFITAFSNDYGYENWVKKAIEFYGEENDTVVLISCSGNSPNVVNAAKYSKESGLNLITFTGFNENNPLKKIGDINFWVDSRAYNIIESVHHVWLLSICDLIIGKTEYSVV